jgi:hypothetical protein
MFIKLYHLTSQGQKLIAGFNNPEQLAGALKVLGYYAGSEAQDRAMEAAARPGQVYEKVPGGETYRIVRED